MCIRESKIGTGVIQLQVPTIIKLEKREIQYLPNKVYKSAFYKVNGLPYFGGKSRFQEIITDRVINLRNAYYKVHGKKPEVFVDVFTGGGKIALNTPMFETVVMNDLDRGVCDFFNSCKKYPDDLTEEIQVLINKLSIDSFLEYKFMRNKPDVDDITNAALTYVMLKFSWMGTADNGTSLSNRQLNNKETKLENVKGCIYDIFRRMNYSNIIVENMDYRECMKKYDKERIAYLDPPYHEFMLNQKAGTERDVKKSRPAQYTHTFSRKNTLEMVDFLKDENFYIMSNYDPKELLKENEDGYHDFSLLDDIGRGCWKENIGKQKRSYTTEKGEKIEESLLSEYLFSRADGEWVMNNNIWIKRDANTGSGYETD